VCLPCWPWSLVIVVVPPVLSATLGLSRKDTLSSVIQFFTRRKVRSVYSTVRVIQERNTSKLKQGLEEAYKLLHLDNIWIIMNDLNQDSCRTCLRGTLLRRSESTSGIEGIIRHHSHTDQPNSQTGEFQFTKIYSILRYSS
jgi:hypothetical protein